MAGYRVSLEMEGFASDEGHVAFAVFLRQLQAFQNTLASADAMVSGRRATTARVVALSHSSPSTVTLELMAREPELDSREAILEAMLTVGKFLDLTPATRGKARPFLKALREMATPVGKLVPRARLLLGEGREIALTRELCAHLGRELASERKEPGEVDGRLERINLHDAARVFYVYPSVGPTVVKCKFSDEMRSNVVDAVDKNVRVSGTLSYRAKEKFPTEMEVADLVPLPDDGELPSIMDVRGIIPGATGKLSSEAFVRQRRYERA